MKSNKQVRREAKQLFRLCLVNGLLNENRARRAVHLTASAGQPGCR